MQLPKIINTAELIEQINQSELYLDLIKQLNKDFNLAGVSVKFYNDETPRIVFDQLKEIILELLQKKFDDFLHILYRIDVNEIQIKKIIEDMSGDIEEQISFIILKRVWQKVWYKKYYTNLSSQSINFTE